MTQKTPQNTLKYDVIVIGGGHAGCEAAGASARIGAKTLLLTHDPATIGEMSCNPAIGGIGKGHLVREIDALDGLMGRVADCAGIQFRLLNRSKGPAVRGPRAQIDRRLYRREMQKALAETPNLTIEAAAVADIVVEKSHVAGVLAEDGRAFHGRAVVLTTGTFLNGLIHIGTQTTPAGRHGAAPALGLSERLYALGLPMGRLRTGTPPRLDGTTIDKAALEVQSGDDAPTPFSFLTTGIETPQTVCHITATTPETCRIVADNITESPIYSGRIEGPGPRYCPSIEIKIKRFPDRTRHQVFLEPEGLDDDTIYPNGLSTGLPAEVQKAFIRTLPGLEAVRITRPGYVIEYDHVDPRALTAGLQVKALPGLFLAGQINGTTGYEEAAAQGLVAGMNAARLVDGAETAIFDRAEAYLGVMIDDLITKGVSEPYRMFTARAEYRLTLRADNADRRLTEKGAELGLVGARRKHAFEAKTKAFAAARAQAERWALTPNEAAAHGLSLRADGVRRSAFELIGHPQVGWDALAAIWPQMRDWSADIRDYLSAEALYAGYMGRQNDDIAAFRRDEARRLPPDLDYGRVAGLATEAREKLTAARPETLGQAARLDGVTPAALTLLLHYTRKMDSDAA